MTNQQQKASLRKDILKRRVQLTSGQVSKANRAIMARLVDLIKWDKISTLHTYMPIVARNEINTWPLLDYIWQNQPNVQVAVPVVVKEIIHSVTVHKNTRWAENKIGIPEPQEGSFLRQKVQFDVIIVPTLGFDRQRNRLGHGLGYYDRFLKTQPQALTIGLVYAKDEIEMLPVEKHDVSLKYIITENEIIP